MPTEIQVLHFQHEKVWLPLLDAFRTRTLVSRDLAGPRTFDEILGGFREEVAANGITDPELDQLFESARQDSLAERKDLRSK